MKLVKVSSNQVVAKYHGENKDGDICGSINVSPNEEEAELLRSWAGERPKMQIQMSATKPNPMVDAMLKAKSRFVNREAILRSC